jgi:hypothetical protein
MNESVSFLSKYRAKGALLDTNLLLVYVVGKTHRSRLSDFHHTKQYEQDFPMIERVVEFFPKIYTTPNVITEVSNLGKKLGADFFETLRKVVSVLDEQCCVSKDAAASAHFPKIGITDAGLCTIAANYLVITADFALYQILRANNVDAVNFHHLRQFAWAAGASAVKP